MRVLICGAAPRRGVGGWKDPWPIIRELRNLPSTAVIIHGNAKGADKLAGELAHGLGFWVIPVDAEWSRYGKGAGPIRNKKMLSMRPDLVLAFHEDISQSSGTKNMVSIARKAGIETKVFSS
ncbi:hypothetical protein LCGC14_3161480 [marine sediment metagenome]|uniref:YspA cpYpsA-related SLOG domain-containing protein n=1 Tax=marine sediment metagenome TaxID=412755 RepID=A0A0F8XXU1_9ZZZZ